MSNALHDRNDRYSSSFLCFIVVCILVVCIADERPELGKFSYTGSNSVSSIVSPENEFYDIVCDIVTRHSVIKSIVSKQSTTGKTAGSRALLTYAVTVELFMLTGACVLFLLYFYRGLAASHHFIIAYIHDLDGMKP